MAERFRAFRLIIATTWRTDWRRCLGTLLEPLAGAAQVLFGLWLALLVNGVLRDDVGSIAAGAGGLAASQCLNYAGNVLGVSIRLTLSEKVGQAFDRRIAELTASLPGLDHQERPDYQDRLELLRQTQGVLGQSLNSLVRALNAVVTAGVTLGLLAWADPLLLLLAAFGLPSLWTARIYQRWMATAEQQAAAPRRLARHFRQLIGDHEAGAELRIWGLQSEIVARHRAAWLASQAPLTTVQRRRGVISFLEQLLFTLAYGAALALSLWRAAHGQTSVGTVLLVAVVGRQVQSQVLGPIYSVAGLGEVLRSAQRVAWLEDYARSDTARWPGNGTPPADLHQGIALERVSFRYPGTDRPVLDDVSVQLPAGSVVALVGENGAGKTTLVKLLCGFYQPTSGRITIDGDDLNALDITAWRAKLAGAFQDFARLELAARRSVGVGDLPNLDNQTAVLGAVERAGATDVIAALPHGLATQLGASWDDGVALSVGQWQKLALARALMRDTPLLVIFDEPTASLDAPTEYSLFERYADALRDARTRGAVTILVTHRFSTVRMADLILVLESGRLVEQGSHHQLLQRHGQYAELYQLQAASYR